MDSAKLYTAIRHKLAELRDEMRRVTMTTSITEEDSVLDTMTRQLVDAILAEQITGKQLMVESLRFLCTAVGLAAIEFRRADGKPGTATLHLSDARMNGQDIDSEMMQAMFVEGQNYVIHTEVLSNPDPL